jgi:hypothetical protein
MPLDGTSAPTNWTPKLDQQLYLAQFPIWRLELSRFAGGCSQQTAFEDVTPLRTAQDRFLEWDFTFKSLYRERTALLGLGFQCCAVGALPIQL